MDKIGKMMGDFMSVSGGLPREFYEKVLGGETCEFLKAKLFERPCYVQKKYNQTLTLKKTMKAKLCLIAIKCFVKFKMTKIKSL